MLEEWEKLASAKGTVELDAWTYCHDLTRNMLARASFGDSYKDGIKIFEIQQEQIDLGLQAIRSVYIPGSKCENYYFVLLFFFPTEFGSGSLICSLQIFANKVQQEVERNRKGHEGYV